jgi:hypothetical protein
MTTTEILKSAAAKMSTEVLISSIEILEATPQDEAGRAACAAMSDVLVDRFNLSDKVEGIFFEDLDFTGTYFDAIKQAMAA